MREISINLATRNRAPFLEKCLTSLCRQTLDPSRYEICVVNNASTDNTPEIVEKIAALYPQHRVFMVSEPVPGLSRARNCGLRATTAPLVASVDDDGTVDPDWLELFLAAFAERGADTAVIGGEISPVWEIPKPEWLTEYMQLFLSARSGLGPVARYLTDDESAREGNSCYRRDALEKAGGFPEELGRAGASLLSGEHIVEASIRKNGARIFYEPRIVLHHFIHANRLNPLWLRQRFFWQGVSKFAIREYQIKRGLRVENEAFINLPLKAEDWRFIEQDTPDNLNESLLYFFSLGFVLALTGLLPIERSVSASCAETSYGSILSALAALPDKDMLPLLRRRRSLWQGVAAYAAKNNEDVAIESLPLDRADWIFINNANEPVTDAVLKRLYNLGFILAKSGFIPVT